MRRMTIAVVLVAALLALTAGVALAQSFTGTDGNNTIRGTREPDRIDALAGNDTVYGNRGGDRIIGNRGDDDLYAGDGRDRVFGGRGNDYIVVQGDGKRDFVDCGSERDVVVATPQDTLRNCEVVK